MIALPFAQLAHGLPEFLNFPAKGFDVIIRTNSLAPWLIPLRFFTPWLFAAGFAFTAQRRTEAVGNLINLRGRLRHSGFAQVSHGLLHVPELSFQFRAGRAVRWPGGRAVFAALRSFAAFILHDTFLFSHRGVRPFFGLTAHILRRIFFARLLQFGGFLHGGLHMVLDFAAQFCFGFLGLLAFALFLVFLTRSIRFALLARSIGLTVLGE